MVDLAKLAVEAAEIKDLEADLKKRRAAIKINFFDQFTTQLAGQTHRLETDSIEIPREFWQKTKLTQQEFFESRFPAWEILAHRLNLEDNSDIFILRKRPEFVPESFEVQDGKFIITISRQVSNEVPDVDWDTLKQEDPDLFHRLAAPITAYEIDGEEYERICDEEPELLVVLRRHLVVKEPTVSFFPRRKEKK